MYKPRLTIGISFYNNRKNIYEMAQCIFAQTFSDWELLLIDDGSTDGGADIARCISDPRVQVFSDGMNKGRPCRYNEITKLAKGEYIVRYDVDDLIHPTKFEKQVQILDQNKDVDVVGTGMLSLGKGDIVKGRRPLMEEMDHKKICGPWPIGHVALCHGGIMARKSWFQRFPYSESYRRTAEDLALWAYSMHGSIFTNVAEPLYYYRDFETQNLSKYCLTKIAALRLNLTVDRINYGTSKIIIALMANIIRMGVYIFATALGIEGLLISKRSEYPEKSDVDEFKKALIIIHSTEVPRLPIAT